MNNAKDLFIAYLKKKSPKGSGKPTSYAKAMEVIEDVLFEKAFSKAVSIWTFITKDNVMLLYDFIKEQQITKDGIFKDYNPPSYWKDAFCSAALKEFSEFLNDPDYQIRSKKILPKDIKNFEIDAFISSLKKSNLKYSDLFIKRFIANLYSKPFILLTGLSGSGKTKIAQTFTQWICDNNKNNINQNSINVKLPVNKSAIEHSGWTLPSDVKKEIVSWSKKNVKVVIDGVKMNGYIDNYPRLFFSKDFKLNSKYQIGNEVDVEIISSNLNNGQNNQYKLIPVGSDWTNREPLLGYPNVLELGKYVKPENGVLNLLIDADNNPDLPFFLILDEMNLSHVERYFADFLSAMESEEPIPLHSNPDGMTAQDGKLVPYEINLPKNLFIIGTVNIDETTYMFSPKVLDRAGVIEFRVTDKDMEEFFNNPVKIDIDSIEGEGAGMAADFVEKAIKKVNEFDDKEEIHKNLIKFFNELKKVGSEFGYRTASEIFQYAGKVRILEKNSDSGSWNINQIIDTAVIQKLLPKLHGSRRKLEPVLKKLMELCLDKDKNIEDFLKEELKSDYSDDERILYPISFEKIKRMHTRLIHDGFTSFAEA